MNFWDCALALIFELRYYLPDIYKLRIVADAYFSKAPFINELLACNIHLVSRLRKDAKAWEPFVAELKIKKRGRPRKKGKEWKIADLINHFPTVSIEVQLYGKVENLQYVVRDLYLRGANQLIRIVVIETKNHPILLMSTDLTLSAKQIIEIYASRFSIELTIRDLKQHFGFADYQCHSFIAFSRFVFLSCVSFCIWTLALLENADFLTESKFSTFSNQSPLSFDWLKRAFKEFICKQILFLKFPNFLDFQKINLEVLPMFRFFC